MLKARAKAETKDGWLAAIRGLPDNPVYRYLRRSRRNPKRACVMQRLRQLATFAVPALALSWLSAEAPFLLLDPRLTGVHRVIEWLSLFVAAQRYTGDGLFQTILVLTMAGCTVWYAISIYNWTVDCSLFLAPKLSHNRPCLQGALESTSASSGSILVAVVAAAIRSLLPLIITWALIYSIIITILQCNADFSMSSVAWFIILPNTITILLRALCLIPYFCLPMLLNTLVLICLGGGSRVRQVAPIAGGIMALAQIGYGIQTPNISDTIHYGMLPEDFRMFGASFHSAVFLLGVGICIALALACSNPILRSACLLCWPLLLLAATLTPIAPLVCCTWTDLPYHIYDTYMKLILPLACGVGAMIHPCAVPLSGAWLQSTIGFAGMFGTPLNIVPEVWRTYMLLLLWLIAVSALGAYLAVRAGMRQIIKRHC